MFTAQRKKDRRLCYRRLVEMKTSFSYARQLLPSQMAEAIVNARYGRNGRLFRGTKPAGYVHVKSIQALNEIGMQRRQVKAH